MPSPKIRSPLGAAVLAVVAPLSATALTGGLTASAAPAPGFCAPASASVLVPHRTPVLDWAENLTYDDTGSLWVSRMAAGTVERYDHDGNRTASVKVEMPGALRQGPDGMMYVLAGNNPIGMIPGVREGVILRFDPHAAQPRAQVFADGFGMPNGLDFDADGNAYVADTAGEVVKVRPDGTIDEQWTARAPQNFQLDRGVNVGGFDGLVVADGAVYVSLLQSVSGRVMRIPLDDPSHATVAADVTEAGIPLLPDDMTAMPDGSLYTATTSGRLVHIDPSTGSACTVLIDQPMTAVAVIPDSGDLAVATELGDVLRVRLGA